MKKNHLIFLISKLKYGIQLKVNNLKFQIPSPTYNTNFYNNKYLDLLYLLWINGYLLDYKLLITVPKDYNSSKFIIKNFINNNSYLHLILTSLSIPSSRWGIKRQEVYKLFSKKANFKINYGHKAIIKLFLLKISINLDLLISFKYHNNKVLFDSIDLISKPGQRIYINSKNKNKLTYFHYKKNRKITLGLLIVSTDRGLTTVQSSNLGGEVICIIF